MQIRDSVTIIEKKVSTMTASTSDPLHLIDLNELEFHFVRASGPGGQNVNKVSSAVELRFDVVHSPSLPQAVRSRMIELYGSRITKRGMIVIEAGRFRTQERNRQDALARLADMLRAASHRPKQRVPTRPSRAARAQRIAGKQVRGKLKQMRRRPSGDD